MTGEDPLASVADQLADRLNAGEMVRAGRLVLHKPLGKGGSARVFEAWDQSLHRRVALKLLGPGRVDRVQIERLTREGRALAAVRHRNIEEIYEAGEIEGVPYIAVEYMPSTLKKRLDEGPLAAQILADFIDAGEGLLAIHRTNHVHRDFKPENVGIAANGTIKLLDFGLVGDADAVGVADDPRPGDPRLTVPGLGTPRFRAPEATRGAAIGPPADQYSFCVSLLDALTRELSRNVHRPDEIPRQLRKLPPALSRIIKIGLSEAPDKRWSDMGVLLTRLRRYQHRWRRRGAVAVFACGLAGMTALLLTRADEHDICRDIAASEAEGASDAGKLQALLMATGDTGEGRRALATGHLDEYTRTWLQVRTDGCVAQRRGQISDATYEAQLTCLRRRRDYLEAVMARANNDALDPDAIVEALSTLTRIDGPAACGDYERLDTRRTPASTPEGRAFEADASREIAEIELDILQRRYWLADERLGQLIARAEATGATALAADLRRMSGWLNTRLGRRERAEADLDAAYHLGLESNNFPAMTAAMTHLGWYLGSQQGRYAEAEERLRLADRLIANKDAKIPAELRAELLTTRGWIAVSQGYIETGEQFIASAIAEIEAAYGTESLLLQRPYNYLGMIAHMFHDDQPGAIVWYGRAAEVLRGELGDRNPALVVPTINTAVAAVMAGDYDTAERTLIVAEDLIRTHEMVTDTAKMEALIVRGEIHLHYGELDEADRVLATAMQRVSDRLHNHDRYAATTLLIQGRVALARGEAASAVILCTQALDLRTVHGNNETAFGHPEALYFLARALTAEGSEPTLAAALMEAAWKDLLPFNGTYTGRLLREIDEWTSEQPDGRPTTSGGRASTQSGAGRTTGPSIRPRRSRSGETG